MVVRTLIIRALFCTMFYIGALSFCAVANAQTTTAPSSAAEEQILLSADRIVYDDEKQIVKAIGNVEVSEGERILLADSVTYDKVKETVYADGNIKVLEPTGEVIFADHVTLDPALKEGFIRHVLLLMEDNSRLAGGVGVRQDDKKTIHKGAFTPCNVCEDNPTPVWQLKAVEIVHDEKKKEITYRHASLEFLGIPVAYTPYFSHPDPSVKRRSGLLAPTFQQSNQLGTVVKAPYYFAFAPNQDMTLTPMVFTEEGVILGTEYRHQFTDGIFLLDSSIAYVNSRSDTNKTFRGHLFSEAQWNINPYWRTGWDIQVASDRTYLDRFNFSSEDILENEAYVEGFEGRAYAAVKARYFQGLRAEDDSAITPRIFPEFEYDYITRPDAVGNTFRLNLSGLSLTREAGTDSHRLSLRAGWDLPYTSPGGHVFSLAANLQGDAYLVNDVITQSGQSETGFVGRVFPQFTASWRYPMVRQTGSITQLIEPIASVVISPNGSNDDRIPNEDSLAFELDETNLFAANRFPGHDRVSSGKRVNYGVKAGLYDSRGRSINAFIGQSFSERENQDDFAQGTGLDDNLSDIVGRVEINPNDRLDLVYRFRADVEGFDMRRNELTFVYNYYNDYGISGNYIFIDGAASNGEFPEREEVSLQGFAKIDENWYVDAYGVRDLGKDEGSVKAGGAFTYTDECFNFTMGLTRDFTRDTDDEPETAVFLRLGFKHLGSLATRSSSYFREYDF